ncbi:hypothetical protein CG401_00295 [Bifidobacteriaceae bacterium NR019]|nr:hypothetical protein CG401_00295 [Bifidobacteriaceae bacterium NR019]RFT36654.1 hypothetical protein CG400_01785 [Bifidobacteriaceae bacterium NR017]
MLSTQARSAFVSIDEDRAELRGCALETGLCFVCADDLPERCHLARRQLGAPSLLRVESTVCFQRKRGLPSSRLTKAGQSCVVAL